MYVLTLGIQVGAGGQVQMSVVLLAGQAVEVNAGDVCEWALEAFKYNHRMILINFDYAHGLSLFSLGNTQKTLSFYLCQLPFFVKENKGC